MHVDDLLGLNNDRRLRLLFEAPLALQGTTQLIHHDTTEGALERGIGEGRGRKMVEGKIRTELATLSDTQSVYVVHAGIKPTLEFVSTMV